MTIKELFAPSDMTVGKPWEKIVAFTIPMLIGNIAIMIPPFSKPCKQTPVILIFSAKHSPALSYFPDIVISGRQQQ